MKNILRTLFVFSILFTVNTYGMEEDKKLNECNVSNPNNQSTTLNEIKECVDEELDKDTEASIALRKAQTPANVEETTDQIIDLISSMTYLILIFTIIGLYKGLSTRNRNEQAKNKSDLLFKSIIVFAILSNLVNPKLFSYTSKELLNTFYSQPIIFYTSMNVQKAQSNTVVRHAISNSKTEISQKVLSISKLIIDNQSCALGYQQEMISSFAKENYEVINSNKEIECVNSFMTEKSGSTLSELNNRLLLPAAIYTCSNQFNGVIKDCGNISAKSDIPELNAVVNTYSIKISDFVNDYAGYMCNRALISNQHNYEAFCTTIKDSQKTTLKTDKTLIEIEDDFFEINQSFINDFIEALTNGVELGEEYESKVNLLDLYGNIKTFLLTNTYDEIYQREAKKQIDYITGSIGESINKENGSTTEVIDSVELVMENAEDFIFYVKRQTDSLFEHPLILKNAINDDFNFIKDINLLFGEYTDGTGTNDFKVSFMPLQIIQDNRNKLIGIASLGALVSQYQINNEKNSNWEYVNTFSMILIAIAFFPELFSLFIIIFTVVGITIKMLEAICMAVIEIFLIIVLKKEPHILMNRLTQLFLGMVIKPIVPIFGLAAGSIFVVVALEMIKSIPLINDNYLITFAVGVVIQCLMIMYLIRKTIWVNSYLHKSLRTDISGFKGDIKKSFKDSKNILK